MFGQKIQTVVIKCGRHKNNIKALLKGEERKFGDKKSEPTEMD